MVSTQATALLGRRPDRELGMDHVIARKEPVLKREDALGAGTGGCGLAARAFASHLSSLSPFFRPSQQTGNFQARVFPF